MLLLLLACLPPNVELVVEVEDGLPALESGDLIVYSYAYPDGTSGSGYTGLMCDGECVLNIDFQGSRDPVQYQVWWDVDEDDVDDDPKVPDELDPRGVLPVERQRTTVEVLTLTLPDEG